MDFLNVGTEPSPGCLDFLTGVDYVVIGSAGLGLSKYNDLDVAVCCEDLPNGELPGELYRTDISKYFSVFPLGNNILIRLRKVDVIVYEHRESLEIVKKAMLDVKKIPKYFVESKSARIELFETALKHHGMIKGLRL